MDILKNPQLFLDSFKELVKIGEDKLGRKLNHNERRQLYQRYVINCSNIKKSKLYSGDWRLTCDAKELSSVKQLFTIYDNLYEYMQDYKIMDLWALREICAPKSNIPKEVLEEKDLSKPKESQIADELFRIQRSNLEKESKKRLSIIEEINLRKDIYKKYKLYHKPIKISNARSLESNMALYFTGIMHKNIENSFAKNQPKEPKTSFKTLLKDKKTIKMPNKASTSWIQYYSQHYRAPIGTKQKLAIIAVAALTAGSVAVAYQSNKKLVEPTQASESLRIEDIKGFDDIVIENSPIVQASVSLEKHKLEEKLQSFDDLLNDFKERYVYNFHQNHPGETITSENIELEQFMNFGEYYKITNLDGTEYLTTTNNYGSSDNYLKQELENGKIKSYEESTSSIYRIYKKSENSEKETIDGVTCDIPYLPVTSVQNLDTVNDIIHNSTLIKTPYLIDLARIVTYTDSHYLPKGENNSYIQTNYQDLFESRKQDYIETCLDEYKKTVINNLKEKQNTNSIEKNNDDEPEL